MNDPIYPYLKQIEAALTQTIEQERQAEHPRPVLLRRLMIIRGSIREEMDTLRIEEQERQ